MKECEVKAQCLAGILERLCLEAIENIQFTLKCQRQNWWKCPRRARLLKKGASNVTSNPEVA